MQKQLYDRNQNINDEIVKHINDRLNKKKYINMKKIPENENQNKIVDIVGKILDFSKQQKGKGIPLDLPRVAWVVKISECKHIKILTTKQLLQRLPIPLAQVKAGNKSENLLNEIKKIIYSLYREEEITKKV